MRLSQDKKRARMNEIEKLLPGIEIENIMLPAGSIDENEKQKLEAEYKKLDESYWEADSKQCRTRLNNINKNIAKQQKAVLAEKERVRKIEEERSTKNASV
ncbi:MAG: hypothetical protein AAGU10_08345 [Methanosarcina mazei]